MNKLLLLSLLLLMALLPACKVKDPFPKPQPPASQLDLLPPATQTGRRTFGCLLNGQAWNLAGSPFSGPLFTANYSGRHLSLVARGATVSSDRVTTGGIIQIEIDNMGSPGKYIISGRTTEFVNYDNVTNKCSFYADAAYPATVEITHFDPVARIVSGTFFFTLTTPGCGQVAVTDGRFDSLF